jgi:hypothetical protein
MARGDFKQRVIFELVDQASGPAAKIGGALSGVVDKLGAIAVGGLVAKAFGEFAQFLGEGADAAAEAETATSKLTAALNLAGPGAGAFADQLARQAEATQRLGSVNAEAVTGVQALLAQIGVGADQLEQATQASIDLSAALGIGLEQAAAQVGRTVNGTTGKLATLVPELKSLSKEALAAGEGIALLAAQFSGTAAAQATTYAASVSRLSEAFEDTAEALGGGLAGVPVSAAVRNFAASLEVLNAEIQRSGFSEWLGEVKTGLVNLGSGLIQGAANLGIFGSALEKQTAAQLEATAATEAAQAAYTAERQALEARAASQKAAEAAQKKFTESVRDLGVVLEGEVNDSISKNNALLLEADELYRSGAITRAGFERIERAVGQAERELNASLLETNATLDDQVEGYGIASTAAGNYRVRVDELTASANRAAVANAQLASSMGVAARDRRSQDEVEAALGAGRRPGLGGTRIRTADGSGSRLLS